MSKRGFLADRLPYIILNAVGVSLAILLTQLELAPIARSLSLGTIAYISALDVAFLTAFLFYDYARQSAFYRELNAALSDVSLEAAVGVSSAVTTEQKVLQDLLSRQYGAYSAALDSYRADMELRHRFLIRWVHQMKTPVSVLSLMAQEQGTGADSDFAADLHEQVEKIAYGLEMVLYTARLGEFTEDFVAQPVDLVALLRSIVNENKRALIRAGVFPRLDAPDEPAIIPTDAKWMRFAFSQVINNAIKYSRLEDDRTRQITISVTPGHDLWRVCIADEGIGIPPEDIGRVFLPFFTGENGRRFPEATGMGLYLVDQICRRLGHRVSVESDPGQGTAFTFVFSTSTDIYGGTMN
jgi:signal transduction histidine kinase